MRSYANKVFEKDVRLWGMTEGRLDPTLLLSALRSTRQWGLRRRTPSAERIGDLLLERRWRARQGLKPEQGGSPDRAGQILDGLPTEEWKERMRHDFFLTRRAGIPQKRAIFLVPNQLLVSGAADLKTGRKGRI